ncbi:unnamed protein product [Polarella glacialis]|uniref:Uncharacterized protein n=1 Tax=Polarella glacialis TaxID=89957 RepID=A0A813EAJ5_POLGL|nr:unnamed protein product [Polarella glacialis]
MEEPHDASLGELQKRVSHVVKEILQEELQELKDLLVCFLRQQSLLSEEIKKRPSTQSTPKYCKRLAPAAMPKSFTDPRGSNGQPVTLEQLQKRHTEWLQTQAGGIGPVSSLPSPSQLRSVIAPASLKLQTGNDSPASGNDSPASASMSVMFRRALPIKRQYIHLANSLASVSSKTHRPRGVRSLRARAP